MWRLGEVPRPGGVALLVWLSGCAAPSRTDVGVAPSSASSAEARPLGDGWETAAIEAAGMDRSRIEALTDTIRRYPDWNIHAVLIERDGRLVYEEYFAGADQRRGRPLGPIVF